MPAPLPSEEPVRPDRGLEAGAAQSGAAVTLLLFAAAREAAGRARAEMSGATVADVLQQARERFGPAFAEVLDRSRVWVNGDPSDGSTFLLDGDEVAVLPPVSGG